MRVNQCSGEFVGLVWCLVWGTLPVGVLHQTHLSESTRGLALSSRYNCNG